MSHEQWPPISVSGCLRQRPRTHGAASKDMHALEKDTQEVVQGNNEGVSPLSGEVGSEGRVGVRGRQEGQDEPILPFSLVLELRSLLCKELLCLVISVCLPRYKEGCKRGERQVPRSGSSLLQSKQPWHISCQASYGTVPTNSTM